MRRLTLLVERDMQRTHGQQVRVPVAYLVGIPGIAEHHGTDGRQPAAVIVLTPAFGERRDIAPDIRLEHHEEAVFFQRLVDCTVGGLHVALDFPSQYTGQFRQGHAGEQRDQKHADFYIHNQC